MLLIHMLRNNEDLHKCLHAALDPIPFEKMKEIIVVSEEGRDGSEEYADFMNLWKPKISLMRSIEKIVIKNPVSGRLSGDAEVTFLSALPHPNLVTTLVWEGSQFEKASAILRVLCFLRGIYKIHLKYNPVGKGAPGAIAGIMAREFMLNHTLSCFKTMNFFGYDNGDQKLVMKDCNCLFTSDALLIHGTVCLLHKSSPKGESLKSDTVNRFKKLGLIIKCKTRLDMTIDDNLRIICILKAPV
jgi:hypothetical protein